MTLKLIKMINKVTKNSTKMINKMTKINKNDQ